MDESNDAAFLRQGSVDQVDKMELRRRHHLGALRGTLTADCKRMIQPIGGFPPSDGSFSQSCRLDDLQVGRLATALLSDLINYMMVG